MFTYELIDINTGRKMEVFKETVIRKAVDEVLPEVLGKDLEENVWGTIENFDILLEAILDEVNALDKRLIAEGKKSLFDLTPSALDRVIGREETMIRITSMVGYPNPALELMQIIKFFEDSLTVDMKPERAWDVCYKIKPAHHLAIRKSVR